MLTAKKPERMATLNEVHEAIEQLNATAFVHDTDPVWTQVVIEDTERPGATKTIRVPITNLSVGRGNLQTVWCLDADDEITMATEIP